METTGQVRGKACDQSWFLGKSLSCEKVQGRFVICHRKKMNCWEKEKRHAWEILSLSSTEHFLAITASYVLKKKKKQKKHHQQHQSSENRLQVIHSLCWSADSAHTRADLRSSLLGDGKGGRKHLCALCIFKKNFWWFMTSQSTPPPPPCLEKLKLT